MSFSSLQEFVKTDPCVEPTTEVNQGNISHLKNLKAFGFKIRIICFVDFLLWEIKTKMHKGTFCSTITVRNHLGAPSILVTIFFVKSPTKSQIFLFQVTKICCIIVSFNCGLEIFIATELYSTSWWLETKKKWWFGVGDSVGDHQTMVTKMDGAP